jgi:hypothetical protein
MRSGSGGGGGGGSLPDLQSNFTKNKAIEERLNE